MKRQSLLRSLFYRAVRLYWRLLKPIVLGSRAIVVKNGEVLLVRLSYTPGWYLPGGGVDRGESFKAAVVRELREECGLEARAPHLFGLYHSTKTGKIDHVAIFIVTDFTPLPDAKPDPEIQDIRFFPIRALPEDVTPATRRRIHEYLHGSDGADAW